MIEGLQGSLPVQQFDTGATVEKSGTFCGHEVRLGSGSPFSLDSIKFSCVPYPGFRTVKKVRRSRKDLPRRAKGGSKKQAPQRDGEDGMAFFDRLA